MKCRSLRLASLILTMLAVPGLVFADNDGKKGDKGGKADKGYQCPHGLKHRTPAQVWADRLAAMTVGDLDRVMCDYADDAVVMTPAGVARGKEQIRAGLEMMFTLLGGALPTVTTLNIANNVIFITFTVDTPIVSIVDGADTYVVEHGLIVAQTAHDPLTFKGPPPAAPAASETTSTATQSTPAAK
ncbi:MAG: nuclear transport factor 2 family protein [Myxococcales bacterium]